MRHQQNELTSLIKFLDEKLNASLTYLDASRMHSHLMMLAVQIKWYGETRSPDREDYSYCLNWLVACFMHYLSHLFNEKYVLDKVVIKDSLERVKSNGLELCLLLPYDQVCEVLQMIERIEIKTKSFFSLDEEKPIGAERVMDEEKAMDEEKVSMSDSRDLLLFSEENQLKDVCFLNMVNKMLNYLNQDIGKLNRPESNIQKSVVDKAFFHLGKLRNICNHYEQTPQWALKYKNYRNELLKIYHSDCNVNSVNTSADKVFVIFKPALERIDAYLKKINTKINVSITAVEALRKQLQKEEKSLDDCHVSLKKYIKSINKHLDKLTEGVEKKTKECDVWFDKAVNDMRKVKEDLNKATALKNSYCFENASFEIPYLERNSLFSRSSHSILAPSTHTRLKQMQPGWIRP